MNLRLFLSILSAVALQDILCGSPSRRLRVAVEPLIAARDFAEDAHDGRLVHERLLAEGAEVSARAYVPFLRHGARSAGDRFEDVEG